MRRPAIAENWITCKLKSRLSHPESVTILRNRNHSHSYMLVNIGGNVA